MRTWPNPLQSAMAEARRRTEVLKSTHYVIKSVSPDEYMVTTRIPRGYDDRVVAKLSFEAREGE